MYTQAGTWTTLRKGATLQEEGQPSASVFLLVSGRADVAVGGRRSRPTDDNVGPLSAPSASHRLLHHSG